MFISAPYGILAQSVDTALVYHLRTDKDIYEYGEQIALIHTLRVGDRAVTLYKFLDPGQVQLYKVYGAMDVPAPSTEIKPSRSSSPIPIKAGKMKQQRSMLESFGRPYPGTDVRYLEPTVYRVAVRFHYRIEGNLSQTFTVGDSGYFTVRRNDPIEHALHRYYREKDSCLRLDSALPFTRNSIGASLNCYERLIDSCMSARETERSPLMQTVLLYDFLRGQGAFDAGNRTLRQFCDVLIDRFRARNQENTIPEYLRDAIARSRH